MPTIFDGPDRDADIAGTRSESSASHCYAMKADSIDQEMGRAWAFIVIPNFAHLAETYGLSVALGVTREIKQRICAKFLTSESADLVCLGDDGFLLRTNSAFACDAYKDPGRPSTQIEALLVELGDQPVNTHGTVAFAHLHAGWLPVSGSDILSRSEIELLSWAWSAQPLDTRDGRTDDAWRERYRTDMDVAVRVFAALAAGRLEVTWRPIIDAHEAAETLYREAITRISPDHGQVVHFSPDFMLSLERLGLTRLFDRLIVQRIVEDLCVHPGASMAVNISAQSARLDHWWASLLTMLENEPALAHRLIVEITAGAMRSGLEEARDFCAQLHRLGCRIAIDDLGAGIVDLAGVRCCSPDIVKLDASFMRWARDGDAGRESLRGMLKLCSSLAPIVVVDGIEVEDDLRSTLQAGARWLQGYYLGGPNVASRALAVARVGAVLPSAATAAPANDDRFVPAAVGLTSVLALAGIAWGERFTLPVLSLASSNLGVWVQQLFSG